MTDLAPMTAAEFRALRERLALNKTQLGRIVDAPPRTLRRWEAGTSEIPGPVAVLMRLLVAVRGTPLARQFSLPGDVA